jgi:lipopolysaccharide transport system permease protein
VTASLAHQVDIVRVLAEKELKVRYRRTLLGYAWSVLNPVLHGVIYWIAFKAILNVKIDNYLLFLLTGLFPWQWLTNTISLAPNAYLVNVTLVKKIAFPRHLIVLAQTITEGLHFVFCIPILAALVVVYGGTLTWAWLWVTPILLLLQGAVLYGIALGIAASNVFFRDLERMLSLGLVVVFYLTPVIYAEKMVPQGFRPLIDWNPFTPLIIAWRRLFLDGAADWTAIGLAAIVATMAVAIGQLIHARLQWKFAEAL